MIQFTGPSLTLGKVANIPIKVHWTFGLIILFIGYIAASNDLPRSDIFWLFSYVLILFAFVILHEFGHALTALKFGIKTHDVIISPIGGVARLEGIPKNPRAELLVALAGPAVNVILAVVFLVIQLVSSDYILPQGDRINFIYSPADFIGYLLLINVVLVLFNLIPAFPMDGGRVLRSLLSMIYGDQLKATRIASIVGQAFAALFLAIGVYTDHYILIFIGFFVFITARREFRQIRLQSVLDKTTIEDVMRRVFTPVRLDHFIGQLENPNKENNLLVFGPQESLVGIIPLNETAVLTDNIGDSKVDLSRYLSRSFGFLDKDTSLSSAFTIINNSGWLLAAVKDQQNKISGYVDRDILLTFIEENR